MFRFFSFVAALSIFCSCSNNKPTQLSPDSVSTDTTVYTMKVLHQNDEDCDSTLSKDCRILDISYPEFTDQPALNDSLSKRIQSIYTTETSYSSVDEMVEGFMADYRRFKLDPNFNNRVYNLTSKTKLVRNDQLIGIVVDSYIYTGGAHGGTLLSFINWDGRARKQILLDDVLKPGSRDSLKAIAERIFRKNEGISTSDPLKQYFFEDNTFALNENYLFTPEGIRYVYNEYEIKPYSSGRTELLLPYSEIRSLLKPESAISHLYKAE
ncbi:MAG: DUF3298 domain-containing protein [Arcticibacter sp.]